MCSCNAVHLLLQNWLVLSQVVCVCRHAQFVVISLRNHMFELADHLVGIYKTNNCTKNVTIEPSKFVVKKDEERPLLQQQRA